MVNNRKLENACPDCGSDMVLKRSKYGFFYGCIRYPTCRCTHGATSDGEPLGIPGDEETRQARMEAHEMLDLFWTTKKERTETYKWLYEQLGIPREECHVGRFDIDMCRRVIELCEARLMEEEKEEGDDECERKILEAIETIRETYRRPNKEEKP